MAVFTPVTIDDLSQWITQYPLGHATNVVGITSGIENSNFFLTTDAGEFVLTIFENLTKTELPFYLNLMAHLAKHGVLVPAPIADQNNHIISTLHNKPASIVTKLAGASEMAPDASHCAQIGAMLAKMHIAAQTFTMQQANLRGIDWWRKTAPVVLPFLSADDAALLRTEMAHQEGFFVSEIYAQLPRGPIHADLFRNNALFFDGQLTGIFDFYFAGCDHLLFDVAVTVNDWCLADENGTLDQHRTRALLDAYQAVRPFTVAEQNAWPSILRASALRFWLSRLFDYHLPREAQLLTPHDPAHFERILRLRISHPFPLLLS